MLTALISAPTNHPVATRLQLDGNSVSFEQTMPLLAKYRPQLWREQTIDRAIAAIVCSPDEIADACEQFYGDRDLFAATEQHWFDQYQINPEDLQHLATRSRRLEKFKEITWGHQLPCQLNSTIRQRLLDELFETWLEAKLQSDLQHLKCIYEI